MSFNKLSGKDLFEHFKNLSNHSYFASNNNIVEQFYADNIDNQDLPKYQALDANDSSCENVKGDDKVYYSTPTTYSGCDEALNYLTQFVESSGNKYKVPNKYKNIIPDNRTSNRDNDKVQDFKNLSFAGANSENIGNDDSVCGIWTSNANQDRQWQLRTGTVKLNNSNAIQPVCKVNRDCEYVGWSGWGECSLPCGGGTRTRMRDVKREKFGDGKECDPNTIEIESEPCNNQPCPCEPSGPMTEQDVDWENAKIACAPLDIGSNAVYCRPKNSSARTEDYQINEPGTMAGKCIKGGEQFDQSQCTACVNFVEPEPPAPPPDPPIPPSPPEPLPEVIPEPPPEPIEIPPTTFPPLDPPCPVYSSEPLPIQKKQCRTGRYMITPLKDDSCLRTINSCSEIKVFSNIGCNEDGTGTEWNLTPGSYSSPYVDMDNTIGTSPADPSQSTKWFGDINSVIIPKGCKATFFPEMGFQTNSKQSTPWEARPGTYSFPKNLSRKIGGSEGVPMGIEGTESATVDGMTPNTIKSIIVENSEPDQYEVNLEFPGGASCERENPTGLATSYMSVTSKDECIDALRELQKTNYPDAEIQEAKDYNAPKCSIYVNPSTQKTSLLYNNNAQALASLGGYQNVCNVMRLCTEEEEVEEECPKCLDCDPCPMGCGPKYALSMIGRDCESSGYESVVDNYDCVRGINYLKTIGHLPESHKIPPCKSDEYLPVCARFTNKFNKKPLKWFQYPTNNIDETKKIYAYPDHEMVCRIPNTNTCKKNKEGEFASPLTKKKGLTKDFSTPPHPGWKYKPPWGWKPPNWIPPKFDIREPKIARNNNIIEGFDQNNNSMNSESINDNIIIGPPGPPGPPGPEGPQGMTIPLNSNNNPGNNFNNPGNGFNNPGNNFNNPENNFNNPGNNFNNPGNNFINPGNGFNNPGNGFNNPGNGFNNPGNNFNNPGNNFNNPGNGFNNPGNDFSNDRGNNNDNPRIRNNDDLNNNRMNNSLNQENSERNYSNNNNNSNNNYNQIGEYGNQNGRSNNLYNDLEKLMNTMRSGDRGNINEIYDKLEDIIGNRGNNSTGNLSNSKNYNIDCIYSKFGCCKDGKTLKKDKKGSNCEKIRLPCYPEYYQGCQDSRFGCCPDGETERADDLGSNCINYMSEEECNENTLKQINNDEPFNRTLYVWEPDSVKEEECPALPDMSDYVKIDEIPCWGCNLDQKWE